MSISWLICWIRFYTVIFKNWHMYMRTIMHEGVYIYIIYSLYTFYLYIILFINTNHCFQMYIMTHYIHIYIYTLYGRYAYLSNPWPCRKIPGPWPRHLGEAANGDDFEGVDGRYGEASEQWNTKKTVVEGLWRFPKMVVPNNHGFSH